MRTTIADLKEGEQGIIKELSLETIPIKLLEMGCLPGNEVTLLHIAPLKDPLYLLVDGSRIAIRKQTAKEIDIDLISPQS
ncbi:MAG: ferrous iron transport protein A [Flavobacteriaceae bacterium]|nr:ferrous iron transport protein A [Flavobacteriaceae bacterium]